MIRSVGSSQAALRAYGTQVNTNANNVANVNTESFQRQEAVIQEDQNSQPQARVRTDTTPGPVRQTISDDGRQRLQEQSNTDLTKEFTGTISAQNSYNANLKTVETADQMTGSIIDIKG